MRTVYIADDGKEFDNGYDCKMYEENLLRKEMADSIHGWTSTFKRLDYTDCSFCERVTFVKLDNGYAAEVFAERCVSEGYDCRHIDDCGCYMWLGDDSAISGMETECWQKITDIIEHHETCIQELRNFLEIMA